MTKIRLVTTVKLLGDANPSLPHRTRTIQTKKPHPKVWLLDLDKTSFSYSKGIINKATILIILINGLIAGPAVSL